MLRSFIERGVRPRVRWGPVNATYCDVMANRLFRDVMLSARVFRRGGEREGAREREREVYAGGSTFSHSTLRCRYSFGDISAGL